MGWFNRMVDHFSFADGAERVDELGDDDEYKETEDIEPPTPLAELMERVMCYREDELRDIRARAYKAEGELAKVEHDLSFATYYKDEALGRIAKIYEILNERQKRQLAKPPIALKYGPPPLQMHVFDERTLDYRRVDVPLPAKMETVRRKGSHGSAPLKPLVIFQSDTKTRKSNLDNEREQATLRQRRGK